MAVKLNNIPNKIMLLAGVCLGVLMALVFAMVVNGEFSWDKPYAVFIAVLEVAVLLLIGSAIAGFKESNPRAHGLLQIFIGVIVVFSQLGNHKHPTDAQHIEGVINIFLSWYFFAEGFESLKKARKTAQAKSLGGTA